MGLTADRDITIYYGGEDQRGATMKELMPKDGNRR